MHRLMDDEIGDVSIIVAADAACRSERLVGGGGDGGDEPARTAFSVGDVSDLVIHQPVHAFPVEGDRRGLAAARGSPPCESAPQTGGLPSS